ncbi:MAG: deoxyribose-phosphate aldolase [Ruminococcaceae bacterium]|nr:deoxyribose-phosphate aldolase [Oscillospiraceae bacterium]
MDNKDIFPHIDHTLLRATSQRSEIDRLCEEALQYGTASVCIPAAYVSYARQKFPELNICTVIGFPLGYSTTAVKCFEAEDAVRNGADEIDMVINLCDVRNGEFDKVEAEIAAVKKSCGGKLLKVIIETCYLTQEEKIALCRCVTSAGADFIKTSTGFGTDGAKIEDIRLFKQHIGDGVRMKAAGGVKTKADLEMFLSEGCERIGTSSAVKLLLDGESNGGY